MKAWGPSAYHVAWLADHESKAKCFGFSIVAGGKMFIGGPVSLLAACSVDDGIRLAHIVERNATEGGDV